MNIIRRLLEVIWFVLEVILRSIGSTILFVVGCPFLILCGSISVIKYILTGKWIKESITLYFIDKAFDLVS